MHIVNAHNTAHYDDGFKQNNKDLCTSSVVGRSVDEYKVHIELNSPRKGSLIVDSLMILRILPNEYIYLAALCLMFPSRRSGAICGCC